MNVRFETAIICRFCDCVFQEANATVRRWHLLHRKEQFIKLDLYKIGYKGPISKVGA
jgi:hypothetical protein